MMADLGSKREASAACDATDPDAIVFERLRCCIASSFAVPLADPSSPSVADLQLLWWHHVASACPRSADVVLAALGAVCRSRMVPGSPASGSNDRGKSLRHDAQILELLTWVWRVRRSDWMKECAEQIAEQVLAKRSVAAGTSSLAAAEPSRVDGLGHEPRRHDASIRADCSGAMLVALLEAGSVMERRDWLASTMTMFDALVTRLPAGLQLHRAFVESDIGKPATLDEYAAMARAALRLFTAFGKPRYLAHAKAWIAALDLQIATVAAGYDATSARMRDPRHKSAALDDRAIAENVGMIDVLTRLHDLTGHDHYRRRARHLSDHIGHHAQSVAPQAALAAFDARVTIKVFGRPNADTRALLRAALDYGLPDRLVLGPGAGERAQDQRPPSAEVMVGTMRLPAMDLEGLRKLSAPGGLHQCLAMRSLAAGCGQRDDRLQ